jgi:hypothetical protein
MSTPTGTAAGLRTPSDLPGDRLTLLSALLALAILFHQQQLDDWAVPSLGLLVTLAAALLLLRPSSRPRLLLLIVLHAVSVVADMPLVTNHWLLLFLAEVAAGVALVVGRLRRDRWAYDAGEVYLRVAPTLRVLFLLVYVVAAVSKVNRDFFDADLSCGVAMVDRLLTAGPVDLRADWLSGPVIWGTLFVELTLPLLLAWRRTRVLGLFGAIGFHVVLSLVGHVPFSACALVYLSLFAPDDLLGRAREMAARSPRITSLSRDVSKAASRPHAVALAAVAVLAVAAAVDTSALASVRSFASLLLFLGYTGAVTAALLACLLITRPPLVWHPHAFRLASPIWLLGPLLVAANAASPYLGAKTQSTFTMYSNVQTEGPHWNHLLVPQEVQVLDTQDRLVRIVRSSDRRMQEAADAGRLHVWAGLQAWGHRNPEASLSYEDGSRHYDVERVGDDERLRTDPLLARLAFYRDVPVGSGNTCRTQREDAAEQHS